jgi:ammonia channel protein AmtB
LNPPLSAAAALATTAVAITPAFAQTQSVIIDPADTAWMITATGFVLMMTIPGLALFYCGMVRKKNVLATMAYGADNFAPYDLSLAVIGTGLLWVGWFGFNGGSALAANSRAVFAIVATHLAASP